MKKIGVYLGVLIVSIVAFGLIFNYNPGKQPNIYYDVYLESELIGTINSEKELQKYINEQADVIKENVRNYKLKLDLIDTTMELSKSLEFSSNFDKANYLIKNKDSLNLSDIDVDNVEDYLSEQLYNYNNEQINEMKDYVTANDIYTKVDNVYTPNGIKIKKVYTYNNDIVSIPEIYKRIVEKNAFTIAGYNFTIKSDNENVPDINIYTIDKSIFTDAIENLITIFLNEDIYNAYKLNEQKEIVDTGSRVENVYVNEDITYKAVNISTQDKIYTDPKDLSAYLLYGDNFTEEIVEVKTGDSIESVAFDNQISEQEFLIFNPQYTSRDNLLVPGTKVVISRIDPKIQIVVETYEVTDKETEFDKVEQYDPSISQGSMIVTQEGVNGLERVTQKVKIVNGEITYVDPQGKEVLKNSIPKIITIGTRRIPSVGSITSWGWPTNSGYTLSSQYGYRVQIFGEGNFHSGIDIAGTGYDSPVKATNNGVIEVIDYQKDGYGNYILINHNNGYYSLYGHMSKIDSRVSVGSIVERGQTIGYVGDTGWATGPHLHFEIRTCSRQTCCVNPLPYLRR